MPWSISFSIDNLRQKELFYGNYVVIYVYIQVYDREVLSSGKILFQTPQIFFKIMDLPIPPGFLAGHLLLIYYVMDYFFKTDIHVSPCCVQYQ